MVIMGVTYLYLFKFFIETQMLFIRKNKLAFVIVHVRNVFVSKRVHRLYSNRFLCCLIHASTPTPA